MGNSDDFRLQPRENVAMPCKIDKNHSVKLKHVKKISSALSYIYPITQIKLIDRKVTTTNDDESATGLG